MSVSGQKLFRDNMQSHTPGAYGNMVSGTPKRQSNNIHLFIEHIGSLENTSGYPQDYLLNNCVESFEKMRWTIKTDSYRIRLRIAQNQHIFAEYLRTFVYIHC